MRLGAVREKKFRVEGFWGLWFWDVEFGETPNSETLEPLSLGFMV